MAHLAELPATSLDPDVSARRARERGVDDVHLHPAHVRRDPDVIARLQGLGLLVSVGVVDDPAEADRLAGSGVAMLCTDDPVRLVRPRRDRALTGARAG